jgi:hypothetical protein
MIDSSSAFEEEIKAVFDASVIIHNKMMSAGTVDARLLLFRVHTRISEHFMELRYLHLHEHDVIIEKIRLEYE